MDPDRLEIVPLDRVPRPAVLELLRTCLGAGSVERSEAFWRWKHENGPFGPSPGLVALDGDVPVAIRVFLRWRWAVDGRTIDAVRAVDTATHPAWRRRGLFRRLTLALVDRCRDEGAAFVFNTPNRTSRAGYLAMGWEDVGRAPLLIRARRPGRVLRAALPGGHGTPRLGPEDASAPDAPPTPQLLRPVDELLADPALAGLLEHFVPVFGRLETPRTVAYLRWRYAEPPGLWYRAAWLLEGASGAAVVVRCRRRRGLREINLSEVLMSRDAAGPAAALELVRRISRLPGVDYTAALAARGAPERRVLRRAGFVPVPLGPRLTVRPLETAGPDPREWNTWRVSAGDLELF